MPKSITNYHYDLTHLRVFLAVVEARSISGGAQRCHLAPSSVSERLSALEEALGVVLLERRARGVRPTTPGHILANHARRCFSELEQMHSDLAPYASGMRGQVVLFANSTSLTSPLPDALATFFVSNPGINIALNESMSADTVSAVAKGRADVGIVADPVSHPDLTFVPLTRERLVVLTPATHSLATRGNVGFIDCLQQPFVSLITGAAMHTFLVNHATRLGQRLDIRVQVNDFFTIGKLVASGAGISIVPQSIIQQFDNRLAAVALNERWAIRRLRICRRKNAETVNPNVQLFIEHLIQHVAHGEHANG